MKKCGFILLLVSISVLANAQTWSEWFRQKKTKIKYLVEQIAALKVYGNYAWKGYSLAKKGLTNIGDIKEGDLAMHSDYFASLQKVNPSVKSYGKVGQIIALQIAVLKLYQQQRKWLTANDSFSADEATYIKKVLTGLLAGCLDIVDELITLTTDNTSEMKDGARLARIDLLYADMNDKYSFLQSFDPETAALSLERRQERSNIKTTQTLFGLH